MEFPSTPAQRIVAIGLSLLVVFVAVLLAVRGPAPSWYEVALFGVLFCLASHQQVDLGDTGSMSGSFIVTMAAIVVLRQDGTVLGPLVVGMCAGLFWPHIRAFAWPQILMNASIFGLAALAGAIVYGLFPSSVITSPTGLIVAASACTAVHLAVNYSFVELWVAASTSSLSPAGMLRDFVGELPQVFPFGILGAFLGVLYLNLGPVVLPLFIAPILIFRQSFASYMRLKAGQQETANILIAALEVKDHYTAGHVGRVARYAVMMGEELKFSERHLERLHYAALMHDIGKLLVPNYLLNKPGRLTAEEFERVREHEDVSVELLEQIDFLAPVASSASGHFAKFSEEDEGEDTDRKRPIEPHIVHVADAYDAMTSTRAYRKALTHEVAVEELRKHAGTQFHPQCVEALISALDRKHEVHGKGYEEEIEEFAVAPPEAGTGSAGLGDLAPSADDRPDEGVVA